MLSCLFVAMLCILWLTEENYGAMFVPGPLTAGHEAIDCSGCHRAAPGSLRQQLQGTAHYLVGLRQTPVTLGHFPVASEQCVDCHQRTEDRHPIYRFGEPRFRQALETVDARQCTGCHAEHTGRRVADEGQFCVACHDDLAVKNDPVDVPHADLVAQKRWDTCLGCHDFHGNHARHVAPTRLDDRIAAESVRAYLGDGPPVYPPEKRERAKETVDAR